MNASGLSETDILVACSQLRFALAVKRQQATQIPRMPADNPVERADNESRARQAEADAAALDRVIRHLWGQA